MKYLLTFLAALITFTCSAQPTLPRRVFLGIRMENLTDDVRRLMGGGDVRGVLVHEVLPQGSGEAAGWKRGDVLIALNGVAVGSIDDVLREVGRHTAGSTITYELVREKKPLSGRFKLRGWPEERYPDLQVIYTAHATVNGTQRAILTRARSATGRAPLVVFIGGIGCYTLDTPLDTARSETRLLNALARMGYVCARLEKPGVGDATATSTPCAEVSFMNEMEGHAAMVRQLKQRPDVDSTDVTIIGHSMGGLFAPLVAKRTPVQRIVAYGTIGSNFIEYLAKTRRTIGEARRWDPERTDTYIKDFCECAVWYFADGLTTEQAAAKKSACADHVGVFDMRSRAYNDELYGLNIPAAWKGYPGRTLLLWGEADHIAARHDHELLHAMLDGWNPGSVTFQVVPHAGHGMGQADDPHAAVEAEGPYQPGVGRVVSEWMGTAW
jgi:pimeloyl-ACP methyl ester carboxylesterase